MFDVKDDSIKKVSKSYSQGTFTKIKEGKLKDIAHDNRLVIDGGHNISICIINC